MAMAIPLGPVTATAVCKIQDVRHDRERFEFIYGTLANHPERGEEIFRIRMDENDDVWMEVIAVWAPANFGSRLLNPITKSIQRRTSQRYLNSVAKYVKENSTQLPS